MARVIAVIPARYHSKRLPGKPLRKVLNKPLIQWVYENSKRSSVFDDIFVASDSDEILFSVKRFGAKVIKTSSYHQTGTDRVAEASRELRLSPKDLVVNIQSDEPLVSPESFEMLVSSFDVKRSFEMATLAHKSSDRKEFENPNVVKTVVDKDGFALYFSRAPIPYSKLKDADEYVFLKHLGIYAYTMHFLQKIAKFPPSSLETTENLEQLRVLENGYRIKVLICREDSPTVNTEGDLKVLEQLLLKKSKFAKVQKDIGK